MYRGLNAPSLVMENWLQTVLNLPFKCFDCFGPHNPATFFQNSTDDMAELITWPHTWVFESNFLRSVLKVNKPFNLLQWKIDNINQLTGENIFSGFFPIGLMFLELCTSSFKVQTTVNNESSKCCQKATFSKISPLQQGVLPLTVN